MAKTNSKYFEYRKSLLGVMSSPTPVRIRIANSTSLKVGQMARVNTSGYVVPGGVGNALLGRVQGLVDNNGIPVNGFGYDTAKTGHTKTEDDALTTASDNQSRTLGVYADVEVGLESILFMNVANGALAQTNLFQMFDLVSTSDQIDQSTASDTSGQMQLVQLDPDGEGSTTKGLFRVAEPQLPGFGNSTQVNQA